MAAGVLVAAVTSVSVASAASGTVRPTTALSAPCTSASYTLTVDVTLGGNSWSGSAAGQVDFVHDDLTANVTLPSNLPLPGLAGATLQLELVGGTAYVAVPPSLAGFVGGASWVSIALPAGINSGIDALLTKGAQWCANSQSLVKTLGHGGVVSSLGTTTGAAPASGVEVHLPGKKVLPALHVSRALSKKPSATVFGTSSVPVDVWTSGQGHLQGLAINSPSASIDLELSNTNVSVNIAAPAGAVPLSPNLLSLLGGLL
jgi:hypothetical protein